MAQKNISIEQKKTQTCRTDLWLACEREEEVGWTGSLGLVDANYDI